MKLKLKKRIDLEEILEDYGLGLYQVTVCFILSLVVMYSSISPISYILTTSDLNYRCEIRQCEDQMKNDSLWLDIAIPLNINGERDQCKMYQFVFQNNTTGVDDKACKLNSFDKSTIKRCQKWVYDTDENTIVKDFGMECDDNKRSLAAVLNVVGQFIGIPFSGFISDKYGRKSLMIIGSMLSAIFGLLRSYSSNFSYFLLFEFLDSMFSCGVYSAAFVLGIELVSLKARVKVNALMGCFYPIGGVILGFVGYLTQDWRIMLRIVYTPALLILGCIWYVPESLQWLLMQNKIVEVALILSKVAKSNKKTLPPSIQEVLEVNPITNQDSLSLDLCQDNENKSTWRKLIKSITSSKELALRLINISFCWVTITLVYYGLASVKFPGDKYLTFMLLNGIELPSFLSLYYFLNHFPRRNLQSVSFFFCGVSCVMDYIIRIYIKDTSYIWMKNLFLLCSKFTISLAINIMYMFTAEMFPTEFRLSLFSIASMFGRLGVLLSTQIQYLSDNFGNFVPVILFGVMTFVAGVLSLFLPETKDKELSNTVEQIELSGEVNITFEK